MVGLSIPAAASAPLEPMPSIGRIVLYRPTDSEREAGGSGEFWPAVITRVWSAHCVNLHVLTDGGPAFWLTSVSRADSAEPRSWRWPPKV